MSDVRPIVTGLAYKQRRLRAYELCLWGTGKHDRCMKIFCTELKVKGTAFICLISMLNIHDIFPEKVIVNVITIPMFAQQRVMVRNTLGNTTTMINNVLATHHVDLENYV